MCPPFILWTVWGGFISDEIHFRFVAPALQLEFESLVDQFDLPQLMSNYTKSLIAREIAKKHVYGARAIARTMINYSLKVLGLLRAQW